MEKPPRHYVALAFLPVVLAVVTLAALYHYHQGEEERRERWQKPEAVFDALGVRPGTRVAQWVPMDTFFLGRLVRRVSPGGRVYAVTAKRAAVDAIAQSLSEVEVAPEPPPHLDAILLVLQRGSEQDLEAVETALRMGFDQLRPRGRFGLIGVGNAQVTGFLTAEDASAAAGAAGFTVLAEERFLAPQFFMVLEKPESAPQPSETPGR